jgi:hypothetical protein
VDVRTLTMEFDSEIVKFNIFNAMWFPSDVNYVFCLDIIEFFMQ